MSRKDSEIDTTPGYPKDLDRTVVGKILSLLRIGDRNYKKVSRQINESPSVVRNVDYARISLARAKKRAWLARVFGLGVLTEEYDDIEDLQVPPESPNDL